MYVCSMYYQRHLHGLGLIYVVFHPSAGSCGSSYWLCRTIQQAGLPTAYNLPNAYIQILNGGHARI